MSSVLVHWKLVNMVNCVDWSRPTYQSTNLRDYQSTQSTVTNTMFIPRPKQAEVLAYTGGKMGVSAVPGSGKTQTLSALAASSSPRARSPTTRRC